MKTDVLMFITISVSLNAMSLWLFFKPYTDLHTAILFTVAAGFAAILAAWKQSKVNYTSSKIK